MKRLLSFAFFLAAPAAFGQKDMTTFQALFTNQGAAPEASAAVRNIGQAAHTAYLIFENKPAHICAAAPADIGFEQSFDGVTYTRFGEQLAAVALNTDGQLAATVAAYGAYPRVRLKIRSFDTVNCQIAAYYSGSVAGQANITLTAGAMTVTNAPDVRPVTSLAYLVDYDSGLVAVPNVAAALTAADTLVYSIYCNNKTAGPVTLTISDNTGPAPEYVSAYSMPAGSFGPIFELSRGMKLSGIKWVASAATSIYCQVVGMQ